MTVRILQGDCRDVLKTLADQSVHCCVTSPPYFGLRDYGTEPLDWPSIEYVPVPGLPACVQVPAMRCSLGLEPTVEAFIGHMVQIFREVRRVLRDDGTLWLNLGDSYAGSRQGPQGDESSLAGNGHQGGGPKRHAVQRPMIASARRDDHPIPRSDVRVAGLKTKDLIGIPWRVAFALQADGWYLRQDIIWHKPNPMPESVRDRCTKAHEYVFLLSKSERYWFDSEAIAEASTEPRVPGNLNPVRALPGEREGENSNTRGSLHKIGPRETRNKRSVWTIATQPFSEAHFATMAPDLAETCIKAGCPQAGVVLDPFGGAGTTGLVADRLQRDALLIELNHEYLSIASRRIHAEAPLFASVEIGS